MSPASPHPTPLRCFLGGDKAQDVVSTLIFRASMSVYLPLKRGEEVLGEGAFIHPFINFLVWNPAILPFLLGLRTLPTHPTPRLAKEECLSLGSWSLRSPACKMRMRLIAPS